MNLQELRTFLTIVETGSLVRASAVLNVTQSTVTARLKTLEETLGQTLLIRSKSGATLTAAGLRLHRYADTITDLWQQARQEVSLPDGMSGICNLACCYDLWPHLGDEFFQTMQASLPDLAISVWLGSQTEVTSWLESGKADLALTYRPSTSARQDQIMLRAEQLALYATTPDSPLRFNPGYVYIEAGNTFGRDHAVAFADASPTRLSFGNAATGLAHILREGGCAYLTDRMAAPHVTEENLFVLNKAPTFSRDVYLTFNKAARLKWDWFDALAATLPQK